MMNILLNRAFKPKFIDQINDLGYTTVFEDEPFDWNEVVATIGWNKAWETHLFTQDSQLAWVQSISAGVDTLPLDSFFKRGILVSNASGIHAESISDHVLGVLFMYTRQLFPAVLQQEKQLWGLDAPHFRPLSELVVTIVGTGKIGTLLAERLTQFGTTVWGINRSGHSKTGFSQTGSLKELHTFSAKSDVVINILPLTKQTNALYDADFFDTLSPQSAFLNVGRGESVVESDLIHALTQEQFAFASLDVTATEPLAKDDPLWTTPNLMITPHISGYTPHFETKFMEIFLSNLVEFKKSKQLAKNQVDLQQGY